MAWSIVGDGSRGPPSDHQRSLTDSQRSLSACRIKASPLARASEDCAARIVVIARARPSSLARALRSPPDNGVGWYFGAMPFRLRHVAGRPAAVFLMASGPLRARIVQQALANISPDRVGTV